MTSRHRVDCWTWTAIDPDTKLIVSYLVGLGTPGDAKAFMKGLADRVVNIGQITSDGFGAYPPAVRAAFGEDVAYAQVVKKFSSHVDPTSKT